MRYLYIVLSWVWGLQLRQPLASLIKRSQIRPTLGHGDAFFFSFGRSRTLEQGMPRSASLRIESKPPSPPVRHRSVILRCQSGDPAAFSELYKAYAPQMYRLCHALVGNPHDAQDCLQLTFTHAFRSIDRFNYTSEISTWLRGIVVRVAANQRRSIRRRWRLGAAVRSDKHRRLKTIDANFEKRVADMQILGLLDGALDRLPAKKRVAFVLYYVEQHTMQEIADLTGTSLQTTRARIVSARQKLMKFCQQNNWSES